ncbi:MAG: serine hydrolase [Rhodothermales bacterium]|nr:serine hydrolase [Rhodothermales bacterium]
MLAAVILLWGSLACLARGQLASDPVISASLYELVEAQYQVQPQTGLVVAVAFPDGSVWSSGHGWSNPATEAPMRPDHRMGFASITKTFVAAVVLQLVDEGVLSLDDALGRFAGPYTHVNAGITIRQLLGHTSGVYNYTNHPSRVPRLREDLSRVWTPDEVLREFLAPPLYFAGTGASYSNSNFLLLHVLLEAATGVPLGDEIRSRLLRPLALETTTFGGDEPPNGEVPYTWSDQNGDGTLDDFRELYLAVSHNSARAAPGSMFSTAGDIARWAQYLFAESSFSASTRSDLLDWHPLSGVGEVWTAYGQGVQQYLIADTEMWGHSGWITGSSSLMVYSPEFGFSIALVDNDNRSNHVATAAIVVAYLRDLDLTSTGTKQVPSASGTLRVHPNPVSKGTALHIDGAEQVAIYDLLGRQLLTRTVRDGPVPVSGLTSGVYLIRGVSGTQWETKVLIIR